MKIENRKQLANKLGMTMKNVQWSWSAVNHEEKKALVFAWEHYKEKRDNDWYYLVLHENWRLDDTGRVLPGFTEALVNVKHVINDGYQLIVALQEPTERFDMPEASPSQEVKVKKLRGSFVISGPLIKEGKSYWFKMVKRTEL